MSVKLSTVQGWVVVVVVVVNKYVEYSMLASPTWLHCIALMFTCARIEVVLHDTGITVLARTLHSLIV